MPKKRKQKVRFRKGDKKPGNYNMKLEHTLTFCGGDGTQIDGGDPFTTWGRPNTGEQSW